MQNAELKNAYFSHFFIYRLGRNRTDCGFVNGFEIDSIPILDFTAHTIRFLFFDS